MIGESNVITPGWPAPETVKALFTTRVGGFSTGAFQSLNLGDHVGDNATCVKKNRSAVSALLPSAPFWLNQIHSTTCIEVDDSQLENLQLENLHLENLQLENLHLENLQLENKADAAYTRKKNQVLAVMAADCLPILLASRAGDAVAVIHAGWKGLASGIIPEAVVRLDGDWIAWMGPAIGPCHYEVGDDVLGQFESTLGFRPAEGRWKMDLYEIGRSQLLAAGIKEVYGGGYCTYCDQKQFFSYRRDGGCGRMAGIIWFE